MNVIAFDAEWSILGALMIDNRFYPKVQGRLSPAHFGDPINGMIFDEIESMIRTGELADAVTLAPRLTELGIWDHKTWGGYLCGSLVHVGSEIDLRQCCNEIFAAWVVRSQS